MRSQPCGWGHLCEVAALDDTGTVLAPNAGTSSVLQPPGARCCALAGAAIAERPGAAFLPSQFLPARVREVSRRAALRRAEV